MKLLGTHKSFRIIFWCNIAMLLAHIILESKSHDINWLRIGERSPLAAICILIEGNFSILLVLAIFEMYYPSMIAMVKSEEAKRYALLLTSQILVWLFTGNNSRFPSGMTERMATVKATARQQQIPFGDDKPNGNGKSKSAIRGFFAPLRMTRVVRTP